MEVAVVERAEPFFVRLSLGVDSRDVRVDELELTFCYFWAIETEKKESDVSGKKWKTEKVKRRKTKKKK